MIHCLNFKNSGIRFKDEGKGEAIVLIHGYLENLHIWDNFSFELSKNHRVISIDLPGHGESEIIDEIHSMELLADAVNEVLLNLKIKNCFLIGHSMGGYVTLAFAEKYPEKLKGFSLFHSVATADTEERKQLRLQQIEMLENGKKEEIISTHVPKVFAPDNVEKYQQLIEELKQQAWKTPEKGIIAILKGMRERKDRTNLLKETKIPVLYIYGVKDNFIPEETSNKHISLSPSIKAIKLNHSGHLGHIEEKNICIQEIVKFINTTF